MPLKWPSLTECRTITIEPLRMSDNPINLQYDSDDALTVSNVHQLRDVLFLAAYIALRGRGFAPSSVTARRNHSGGCVGFSLQSFSWLGAGNTRRFVVSTTARLTVKHPA
ncbi:MAG: hypothetical protein AAFV88_22855 [Planctomycetota bacterium]